jgi:hypothetical protein
MNEPRDLQRFPTKGRDIGPAGAIAMRALRNPVPLAVARAAERFLLERFSLGMRTAVDPPPTRTLPRKGGVHLSSALPPCGGGPGWGGGQGPSRSSIRLPENFAGSTAFQGLSARGCRPGVRNLNFNCNRREQAEGIRGMLHQVFAPRRVPA